MTAHPLKGIPVEPWMFRRAREQAELLMQIAMSTPQGKSDKPATEPRKAEAA